MTNHMAVQKAYLQFVSCTGEGMQVEILAGSNAGEFLPDRLMAIARIIADDSESLFFEFFTPEGSVRMPLSEVERAIGVAKTDVHGEAWYDSDHTEV